MQQKKDRQSHHGRSYCYQHHSPVSHCFVQILTLRFVHMLPLLTPAPYPTYFITVQFPLQLPYFLLISGLLFIK